MKHTSTFAKVATATVAFGAGISALAPAAHATEIIVNPLPLYTEEFLETPKAGEENSIANGGTIEIPRGQWVATCTATVVRDVVLTAGHCGTVGEAVHANGQEIGHISRNMLEEHTGWDIAEISLNQGVHVNAAEDDVAYTPSVGDPVSKEGRTTGHTEGVMRNPELHQIISTGENSRWEVTVWEADLVSSQGDSGGPVMHDGKVIGMIQGGVSDQDTSITPIFPYFDANPDVARPVEEPAGDPALSQQQATEREQGSQETSEERNPIIAFLMMLTR